VCYSENTIKKQRKRYMETIKKTKTVLTNSEARREMFFNLRQALAQGLLAGGTIAFVVQNAEKILHGWMTYALAGLMVGLVLYFGNKR
jgi:hypothetical protein